MYVFNDDDDVTLSSSSSRFFVFIPSVSVAQSIMVKLLKAFSRQACCICVCCAAFFYFVDVKVQSHELNKRMKDIRL